MGVYKPAASRFWHYDFQFKGRRFHGSTGVETRRLAEQVERRLRADAALGRLGDGAQLTLDQAAGKWWAEKGRHRGDAADVERRVERLLTLIDKDTRLVDITAGVVSSAIEKRRDIPYRRAKADDAALYRVSAATVNRDVIDTLRPILRRAKTHWDAQGLPEIDWGELRLAEPREIVRVYAAQERADWAEAAEDDSNVGLALRLLLKYGLRLSELFFPLDAFTAEPPTLEWTTGRKHKVPHRLPLIAADGAEIAARIGRAREAGLDHIWFDELHMGQHRPVRLVAVTYYALQGRLNRRANRAKIKGGRRIHGARHHAGTEMLRQTGNLRLAQRLLGHADIKSTMKYAHALEDDLRAALDPEFRNSPEGGAGEAAQATDPAKKTVA